MFDIDVSVIKDTVPEEPCTFPAVTRLPLEGCPWQFILDISDASCGKFRIIDVVYVNLRDVCTCIVWEREWLDCI